MKPIKKPKPLSGTKRFLNSFNTYSLTTWLLSWCKGNIYILNSANFFKMEVIGNIHENPELLK
jgi:hypothetical protein